MESINQASWKFTGKDPSQKHECFETGFTEGVQVKITQGLRCGNNIRNGSHI